MTFRQELSPFLLHGWSPVIEQSYRHRSYFLAAAGHAAENKVSAVLPLVHFHGPAGRNRLVSLPYLDYAGLAADDRQSGADLLTAALSLGENLGAEHVELRQDANYPLAVHDEDQVWKRCTLAFKVGLSRFLPENSEMLWLDVGPKVRNQVRKARKSGCRATVGGEELLGQFYQVFGTNMLDLCSPVHPVEFFSEMFNRFRESARIVLVEKEGLPLASSIVIRKAHTLYNPWASSLRAYRPLCANMMLYWAMLSWACEQGLCCFDFGRSSPGSPAHRFKRQWGAKSRPLLWEIFSVPGREWNQEKESLTLRGWNSLTLAESYRIGPRVRRWISL